MPCSRQVQGLFFHGRGCGTSQYRSDQSYFSYSAFERSAIIEADWNWSCVAMQKKYWVSSLNFHSVTSPRSCFVDFRRSIGSIRLSSNQQILLHNCIEKLHSARQCPMKIVNLTLRSALDECFLAPPPIEMNKFETQVRCMSTKIPIKFEWEGDTINTAKNLWYTYSSIRVVEVIVLTRILDHLMRQIAISDGWIN